MSTKKDGNVSEDEENQLNEAILASISDGSLQTGRSDINNESIIPKIIPPPPLNIEKVSLYDYYYYLFFILKVILNFIFLLNSQLKEIH